MKFNYYYGTEADQFTFIRIPKVLLKDPAFAELSIQAKMLYGVLLDRMGLSMKNNWLDEENRVYIIYQISEIQEDLGFSKKKSIDYLAELEQFGLVEKKRRGLGLSNIIYVKSFMTAGTEQGKEVSVGSSRSVETGTSGKVDSIAGTAGDAGKREAAKVEKAADSVDNQTPTVEKSRKKPLDSPVLSVKAARSIETGTSRSVEIALQEVPESILQEVPDGAPVKNNNKYINTYCSDNQSNLISSPAEMAGSMGCDIDEMAAYSEIIKENIGYKSLLERYPHEQVLVEGIFDLILEVVLNKSDTILIASNQYPRELVKSKFLKLTFSHIEYVMDCMSKNTTKVMNIKKYLLAALFNAPSTIDGYYKAEVNHSFPQFAR